MAVTKSILAGADHGWIGKTSDASEYALRTSINFIDAHIGDHQSKQRAAEMLERFLIRWHHLVARKTR